MALDRRLSFSMSLGRGKRFILYRRLGSVQPDGGTAAMANGMWFGEGTEEQAHVNHRLILLDGTNRFYDGKPHISGSLKEVNDHSL